MARSQVNRLVETAVRCYPRRWRDRHGDEAIELAGLLMSDGAPAVAVAWSYLRGAARERLVVRPRRRLATTLAGLLASATLVGVPFVLLDSLTPASADSGNEVVVSISNRELAVPQLESAFRLHHFRIRVEAVPSSPSQVGSILAVTPDGRTASGKAVLRAVAGPCAGGAMGCTDALGLPVHYSASAEVLVGRPARRGEDYYGSPNVFAEGELLHCSGLLGETVSKALPILRGLHVNVVWDEGGGQGDRTRIPSGALRVLGGHALSASSVSISVSSTNLSKKDHASSRGQGC
jgi:hypothetical protein